MAEQASGALAAAVVDVPVHVLEPDRELWIDISPLGKGLIWLNGRGLEHNLGRYWNVNGYTKYFVPKCWLQEENEIVLFEEEPRTLDDARGVKLEWDRYAVAAATEI